MACPEWGVEVLSHSCSSRSRDEGAFEMDCFEVLAPTQTSVLRACLGVQEGKAAATLTSLTENQGGRKGRLLDCAYDDQRSDRWCSQAALLSG